VRVSGTRRGAGGVGRALKTATRRRVVASRSYPSYDPNQLAVHEARLFKLISDTPVNAQRRDAGERSRQRPQTTVPPGLERCIRLVTELSAGNNQGLDSGDPFNSRSSTTRRPQGCLYGNLITTNSNEQCGYGSARPAVLFRSPSLQQAVRNLGIQVGGPTISSRWRRTTASNNPAALRSRA